MRLLLLLFLFIAFSLCGYGAGATDDRKVCTTFRVLSDAPVIDGLHDDPAWQGIEWETCFIQHEPYEGKEPSQETAFKILYDDDNVYVAIRAFDTNPDSIIRRLTRKDDIDGDFVGILFDSYLDYRTAFAFMVSAAGVKMDFIISNDGENEDDTWDPVWWVKSFIDEEGWTAEMKIPLSQLRFDKDKEQVWGLEVIRSL